MVGWILLRGLSQFFYFCKLIIFTCENAIFGCKKVDIFTFLIRYRGLAIENVSHYGIIIPK